MKFLFAFLLSLGVTAAAFAQTTDSLATVSLDSLQIDSTELSKEEKVSFFNFQHDWPNPGKAAKLSLMLPGAGQIYNKRWWKLPFVYGAIGGIVYAIDYNQGTYRRLRTALELKLEEEEHEFSGTPIDNATSLRNLRDGYDKNTQLSYIGAVLLYGVIAIEAFVDAHLIDFDIDDDLSIDVQPSFHYDPSLKQSMTSVGVVITF